MKNYTVWYSIDGTPGAYKIEVTARTMASARDLGMKYLGKGTKVTRVVLTN